MSSLHDDLVCHMGKIRVCNTNKNVHNWKRNALETYIRQLVCVSILRIVAPKGGWGEGGWVWRTVASPTHEAKFKIYVYILCRHYGIKGFMWFKLQPKSANEIGWLRVDWSIEKYNKNFWICSIFSVRFNFSFNLTSCRLWDCDIIFHNTVYIIKYKLYADSGSDVPKEKFWSAPMILIVTSLHLLHKL